MSMQFTEEMKQKLKALCLGKDALKAGRVQFLGLDRLEQHFGPSWHRHRDRAFMLAKRVLQRRLRPIDLFWELPGSGFVFVSGDASPQEAQLRCAMIGDEIARLLLGEEALAGIVSAKTVVSELDGILSLMPGGQRSESSDAEPNEAANGDGGGFDDWDIGLDLDNDASRRVIGFRPIWSPKKDAVFAFRYLSGFEFSEGPNAAPASTMEPVPNSSPIQGDLLVLGNVVSRVVAEFRKGFRFLTTVPVHLATFRRTSDRLSYMQAIHRLSQTVRAHLIVVVVGADETIPQSRMVEIVSPLRGACRTVVVRVDRLTTPLGWVAAAGAQGVSCEVEPGRDTASQVLQSINRFAAEAERNGLTSCLNGVSNLPTAVAAACAGIDFIDGDAIGSVRPTPGAVMRYSPLDLYRSRSENESPNLARAGGVR